MEEVRRVPRWVQDEHVRHARDKIEAACGPKFAYVHYTANYALKNVAPFDTPNLFIPQADNFLAKVKLP